MLKKHSSIKCFIMYFPILRMENTYKAKLSWESTLTIEYHLNLPYPLLIPYLTQHHYPYNITTFIISSTLSHTHTYLKYSLSWNRLVVNHTIHTCNSRVQFPLSATHIKHLYRYYDWHFFIYNHNNIFLIISYHHIVKK